MLPENLRRAIRFYYPALVLERMAPYERRKRLAWFVAVLAIPLLAFIVLCVIGPLLPANIAFLDAKLFVFAAEKARSLLMLLGALELVLIASNTLYFSSYFASDSTSVGPLRKASGRREQVRFEVALIALNSPRGDLLRGFAELPVGSESFLRCGIDRARLKPFVDTHEWVVDPEVKHAQAATIVTVADLARYLSEDRAVSEFLQRAGVTRETFIAATRWVERRRDSNLARHRWWSRERLKLVPSLGEDWSYGGAYGIRRYATPVANMPAYAAADLSAPYGREEADALETILSRALGANGILVGEDSAAALETIARLAKKMATGGVAETLRHKEILIFNTEAAIAASGDKTALERLLVKLLDEAASAGNLILCIQNLPAFVASARALGVDAVTILDPYLAADTIQLVATAAPDAFHEQFGGNVALAARFEQIFVKPLGTPLIVRLLEDKAAEREAVAPVFFTHPALSTIATSANQYFAYGIMPDKAFDLMYEAEAYALEHAEGARGRTIIDRGTIERLITEKTGIPSGAVGNEERGKLLGLKDALRKRVIGQDSAVEAVGNALLRSRSGIGDKERPLGVFLFLGPTGVGKTETAKALAASYFGAESAMLRLDMSEYSTPDAMSRLIGSFAEGRPGVLTAMIREHPYGVLLLDEFEKALPEVHNLFLQIFDEGLFSDAHGKHVSARNLIIIATSNAGADLIWRSVEGGGQVAGNERLLIDAIIERNIFKPELLNRFDEIVVFRPLDHDALRSIARIMLAELALRLRGQGVTLSLTDELVGVLAEEGYDPQFGARPMRRALQDTIEQAVAERIVAGIAGPGTTVNLTAKELARYRSQGRSRDI